MVLPGLQDETADLDALVLFSRLAFCGTLHDDTRELLLSRSVSVSKDSGEVLSDAWLLQRELGGSESLLFADGRAIATICAAACEAAIALKKKTDFAV